MKDVFQTGTRANGYIIDSLYDLGSRPMAQLNDLPTNTQLVGVEAANMKTRANSLGVFYAYGIPATASAHEWEQCAGGCAAGADGSTGNPMIEYTKRAVNAIKAAGAPDDPAPHPHDDALADTDTDAQADNPADRPQPRVERRVRERAHGLELRRRCGGGHVRADLQAAVRRRLG